MKKFIFFLFTSLIILLILPCLLYFIPFHGNLSADIDEWTCFATVLSASIGTAISAITLFILLIDRKSNENEKRTNQYIDYLFRQNEKITKNYTANGYIESPIEEVFSELNAIVEDSYCFNHIYSLMDKYGLKTYSKEVQDYFLFGYQVARKTINSITVDYFDSKLSEHWKKESIRNAFHKSITIKDEKNFSEQGAISSSTIKNNLEALYFMQSKFNSELLQNIFRITNPEQDYPYSVSAFINTYRYALIHLVDYDEGLSLYFSQLSLEQKIFIASDIRSMENQSVYNKLSKNKKLRNELLTSEVLEKSDFLKYIYDIPQLEF